ncbi:MAG: UrcA family protein [Chromatiales bacterium]|nr:UrcA family protein [Chromatiales bacterium]
MNKLIIGGSRATALAAVAVLASLGMSPAVTFAAEPASAVVDASAVNLASGEGVAALYADLRRAAESVCGLREARGYASRSQARRCVRATLDAVVAEVGARPLTTQHHVAARVVRRPPEDAPSAAAVAAGR